MTQPVQEPSQGRIDQAQEFRTRQLFRRPAPLSASQQETGWTVVFGDGATPVVTGDNQAIWKVPRQIVSGEGIEQWYIYQPSAAVLVAPTVDIEIWLYRVRTDGSTILSTSSLLDSALVIDAGTFDSSVSASPVTVTQYANLYDDYVDDLYDSIMVGIDAGDGSGLSINVPIGIEQPFGSGYHIP